jgi:hypothetical protein
MGCQDKNFLLDGEKYLFPEVPTIVPYIVDFALSGRHKEVWQFNPSTLYGRPRAIPAAETKIVKAPAIAPFVVPKTQNFLLLAILVALFNFVLYFLFL